MSRFLRTPILLVAGSMTMVALYGEHVRRHSTHPIHEHILRTLHQLDAERAHRVAMWCAKHGFAPWDPSIGTPEEVLRTRVWQREFVNPVGLAAGFDKHGEAMEAMYKLGFGFVEIGTVTPHEQFGNPKPRMWRSVQDGAIVNRYGFNSDGMERVAERIDQWRNHEHSRYRHPDLSSNPTVDSQKDSSTHSVLDQQEPTPSFYTKLFSAIGHGWHATTLAWTRLFDPERLVHPRVLGINIGKNRESVDAAADYAHCVERLAPYADYITINVSSPNTPGLRKLQTKDELERILSMVHATLDKMHWAPTSLSTSTPLLTSTPHSLPHYRRRPVVLVKVAPHLTKQEKAEIVELALLGRMQGIIICNTSTDREGVTDQILVQEPGGLSGRPLMEESTQDLAEFARLTQKKVPLIGVGGIFSGEDAYRKIRKGASLVQIYTVLAMKGPGSVSTIKQELAELLKRDGFKNVEEAVGVDIQL